MVQLLKNKQNGFTLLETLIVLSIFLTLIAISVPIQTNTITKQEEATFFNQFEEDILLMQSVSITNGSFMKLTIFPKSYYYEIRDGGLNRLVKRRHYSSYIEIDLETFKMPFYFYPSGTPNLPGSFKVKMGDDLYKITFPFGKGRYYVTKQ